MVFVSMAQAPCRFAEESLPTEIGKVERLETGHQFFSAVAQAAPQDSP